MPLNLTFCFYSMLRSVVELIKTESCMSDKNKLMKQNLMKEDRNGCDKVQYSFLRIQFIYYKTKHK